jgi:hypothetical protein
MLNSSISLAPKSTQLYYLPHLKARLFAFAQSVCITPMTIAAFSTFRDYLGFGHARRSAMQAVFGVALSFMHCLLGLVFLHKTSKPGTGGAARHIALRSHASPNPAVKRDWPKAAFFLALRRELEGSGA